MSRWSSTLLGIISFTYLTGWETSPYDIVMATIEFLTINEAAALLERDRKMVYYWVKQGKLTPYYRYGKMLLRPEEVMALAKHIGPGKPSMGL